ncbi:type II toxin-antitoxin system VapC family toxin [Iamia sp.]|uniref:type II toxin-antitoxin system VapC family toxin n=1 Tax=Iamia sp. TaxID=2722710 RepID=UPI002C8BE46B|nr:type II toxin-antitoxin system VapC family toxin [Iamia sp.]HXH57447.1 type II toxin-antitoxin system VapC family toxin [Iamia sp.]
MTDGHAVYIDTSAFLKLAMAEEHSHDLGRWALEHDASFVSSYLLRVEAVRAVRRRDRSIRTDILTRLEIVRCLLVSQAICDAASELDPLVLRTLDAIHVATALKLAPEVDTVLTYDRRMADAVAVAGLTPLSPGQA